MKKRSATVKYVFQCFRILCFFQKKWTHAQRVGATSLYTESHDTESSSIYVYGLMSPFISCRCVFGVNFQFFSYTFCRVVFSLMSAPTQTASHAPPPEFFKFLISAKDCAPVFKFLHKDNMNKVRVTNPLFDRYSSWFWGRPRRYNWFSLSFVLFSLM